MIFDSSSSRSGCQPLDFVQPVADRNALRREDVAGRRRPFGIRDQHFVARLEQRPADDVQPVDAAVGDEHVLDIVDRDAVLSRSFAAISSRSRGMPVVCT